MRCRMLKPLTGTFSNARAYFLQWQIEGKVVAESVRMIPLAHETAVLLVFKTLEGCLRCENLVPPGLLLPPEIHHLKMRMCCASKSFCPTVNFPNGDNATTCMIHHQSASTTRGTKGKRALQATVDAALQDIEYAMNSAYTSYSSGASSRNAEEDSPSVGLIRPAADEVVPAGKRVRSTDELNVMLSLSDIGTLLMSPSLVPMPSGALREPISDVSLAPARERGELPLLPVLQLENAQSGSWTAAEQLLDPDATTADRADEGFSTTDNASSTSQGAVERTRQIHTGDAGDATRGEGSTGACSDNNDRATDSLTVQGTLLASGQTLKASGSAMWTVLSDARLKETLGDVIRPLDLDLMWT